MFFPLADVINTRAVYLTINLQILQKKAPSSGLLYRVYVYRLLQNLELLLGEGARPLPQRHEW